MPANDKPGKGFKAKEPKHSTSEGRPSSYDPIYCKMLVDHRSNGYSFKSFAAICKPLVCIRTLYQWAEDHPEFSHAMQYAYPACLHFWETQANEGLHNQTIKTDDGMTVTKSVNAQVLKFQMSNLFPEEYKERREITDATPGAQENNEAVGELVEWLKTLSTLS